MCIERDRKRYRGWRKYSQIFHIYSGILSDGFFGTFTAKSVWRRKHSENWTSVSKWRSYRSYRQEYRPTSFRHSGKLPVLCHPVEYNGQRYATDGEQATDDLIYAKHKIHKPSEHLYNSVLGPFPFSIPLPSDIFLPSSLPIIFP